MLDRINAMRSNSSLPLLAMNDVLTHSAGQFAWEQASMMVKGMDVIYPPHIGMNFSTPRTRMLANGYLGVAWGENEIITATTNVKVAEELLELDLENRKNMLGDYDHVGIGFAWVLCRDLPSLRAKINSKASRLCKLLQILPEPKRCIHIIVQQFGKHEPDIKDISRIKNNKLEKNESDTVARHHYVLKPFMEQDMRGSVNLSDLVKQQRQERAIQTGKMQPVIVLSTSPYMTPPSDILPSQTIGLPVGVGSVSTGAGTLLPPSPATNPVANLKIPDIPPDKPISLNE